MRDVHGATNRKGTLKTLHIGRYQNTTDSRNRGIPNSPTATVPPDVCLPVRVALTMQTKISQDEGRLSSEDEESLSSGDEGHLSPEGQSSSEDEQGPTPQAAGEGPARDHQQSFGCDLCPESFLTIETLTMVTIPQAVCWTRSRLTLG